MSINILTMLARGSYCLFGGERLQLSCKINSDFNYLFFFIYAYDWFLLFMSAKIKLHILEVHQWGYAIIR